jgi:hypothetical protein
LVYAAAYRVDEFRLKSLITHILLMRRRRWLHAIQITV